MKISDENCLILPLADCHDPELSGGKALNLSQLIRAGFSVPDGFVVTIQAFQCAFRNGELAMPPEVAEAIGTAYRQLGSPPAAIRSSATTEDGMNSSMAGLYETFLDIQGEEKVLEAVKRCWASLDTPRSRVGLAASNIPFSNASMAVVVQKLVQAEIAGVLFTENPQVPENGEMVIEAAYGLGDGVVSGAVQPDRIVIDGKTGAIQEAQKPANCLKPDQVQELWTLGLRVSKHFGCAQDIEWAFYENTLYVLQSRPITTLKKNAAYEETLHATRKQLHDLTRAGKGPWASHNLSDTLPHPTPLTWSVIRHLMSGQGGMGRMYRQAGFQPSETVRHDGFLDLIAGRIYLDLARGPEMFFENFPFRYDLELLRANPDAIQGAPTIPSGPWMARFRMAKKIRNTLTRLRALSQDFDIKFEREIIPAFVTYIRSEKKRDLSTLTATGWIDLWKKRREEVLEKFAAHALMPGLISGLALEDLRDFCAGHFWDENPAELADLLAVGPTVNLTLQAAEDLHHLAAKPELLNEWLEKFGHRAPEEFDLATPRWKERPELLKKLAAQTESGNSPLSLHQKRAESSRLRFDSLSEKLSPAERVRFGKLTENARRYLPYRENGKYFLMLGHDLLREMALEAGRRLEIGSDVFLLDEEMLFQALANNNPPRPAIESARLIRQVERRIALPPIITAGEIADLGKPVHFAGGEQFDAFPVSFGSCAGPVRIVHSPSEVSGLEKDCILVCPSTDPNWTPLFANAAGLVIERGGSLSHGAVIAREMGLPAVVLEGATKIFRDGEIISIEGKQGVIFRGAASVHSASKSGPGNLQIPRELVPPPPGDHERASGRLRNIFFAIWGVYLLAAFLLPSPWLYNPSLRALDEILWPLVSHFGKPAAVIMIALALAALTMVGQRFLTDNHRLLVAKDRAKKLRKEAARLPENSPRAQAMLALASPVPTRLLLASLVPLALILGPMVISFCWFPTRVDPASWNAAPGSVVFVTAHINGEYSGEVTLSLDPALSTAEYSPLTQTCPPIRATLEKLRAKLESSADKVSPEMLADLNLYLQRKIPDRNLAWTLYTPPESGRFAVSVSPEKREGIKTFAVLGDLFPPELKEEQPGGKPARQIIYRSQVASPIEWIQIDYKESGSKERKPFWKPFAFAGLGWEFSWLMTYLIAYLPGMYLFRWILRIP